MRWIIWSLVASILFFNNPLFAQTSTFVPNFNTQFKVNGNASVTTPTNRITLTPNLGSQSGSAFSKIQVDFAFDFSINLTWFMGASDTGADGTGFVFHNDPRKENTIGGGGGSIGLDGIVNSIMYKFDTYYNGGTEPNCTASGDFWAFGTGTGPTWTTQTCFATNIENNATHACIINWNATTKVLTMSWNGTTLDTRTLSNISTLLGGTTKAYFGFTGATGALTNLQQVTVNSITGNFASIIRLDDDESTLPVSTGGYRAVTGLNLSTKVCDADAVGASFADFSSGQRVTAIVTIPSALSSESFSVSGLPSGVTSTITTVSGNRVITLANIASTADIGNAINAVRYTIASMADIATLNYSRTLTVQLSDIFGNSNTANVELSMLAPGGIANGYLGWYRGDNANNTASSWKEQNSTNNATVDIGTPTLNTSGTDLLNFNGTYTMSTAIMNLPVALNVGGNGQPYSFFGVAKQKGTSNARVFSSEISNNFFGYYSGLENALYINGTPNFSSNGSNGVIAATTNLNQFSLNRTAAEVVVQRKNGVQVNSNNTSNDASWRISLGGYGSGNNETSNVIIGEFITYNTDNSSNYNVIESYLATKYGISRNDGTGVNYIASNNSTVYWDISTNNGFNNDIFGVGRDDLTLLHQRISTSANTDDFLIISTDNNFSTSNTSANHTDIAQNLSFLMVGNDNGSSNIQFTDLESNIYNGRIGREWKVQATNFSQAVNLEFTGWGTNSNRTVYLLKKNGSPDFSSGTTQVGALDANGRIAGVVFNNNDYFTLATVQLAPGGVLNGLSLWYRADAGTSTTTHGATVSSWQNQFNGASATATATPTYQSSAATLANFNPTIFFDSSAAGERFNVGGAVPTEPNSSMFVVGRPGLKSISTGGVRTVFRSNVGDLDHPMVINTNDFLTFYDRQPSNTLRASTMNWNEGELALVNGFIPSGSSTVQYAKNGSSTVSTATSTIDPTGQYNQIGGDGSSTRPFGYLADAIVYNINSLSAAEINRVNAYLALKYGISLNDGTGANYTAGDGTTIFWNSSNNSGYNNDVFGIGRDDRSNLQQKQSISANQTTADIPITIYLGDYSTGSFPAANANNSNSFSADNSFLMVGNDNAGISTFVRNSETPKRTIYKLPREWKIQETGTIETVTMVVPVSSLTSTGLPSTLRQNYTFLVSNSNDFSDANVYPMAKIGTNYIVTVQLTDGQFFSFGYGENTPFMRHGKSVKKGEKNPLKF